jgi:hypothetical protein
MTASTSIFDYVGRGTHAARPATPNINSGGTAAYYETDTTNAFMWSGAAWVQINAVTTLAAATDAAITTPATNDILVYVSSKWTNERQRYDIAFSAPQVTAYTASQVVGAHRFSVAVTIPANFGAYLTRTSKAGGSVATTASTVFNVDKAASASPNTFSNVGTITFAISSVTPTFASSGSAAISFAAGDVVRVVGPASPDATFVGFYFTMVGSET